MLALLPMVAAHKITTDEADGSGHLAPAEGPIVATFHTAGVTHEARRSVARSSATQLAAMLRGERPPQLVNPEVWPLAAKRIATLT